MKTKTHFSLIRLLDTVMITVFVVFLAWIVTPRTTTEPLIVATISRNNTDNPNYRTIMIPNRYECCYAFTYPSTETNQFEYPIVSDTFGFGWIQKIIIDNDNNCSEGYFRGNVFVIESGNQHFICTAIHCVDDLDIPFIQAGADIAIIQNDGIYGCMNYSQSFTVGRMETDAEIISVKGYHFKNSDTPIPITISGLGIRQVVEFDSTSKNPKHKYFCGNSVFMKLDQHYKVYGLSGSPAFNNKGEVIGVLSSEEWKKNSDDTPWVRISLFEKVKNN